MIMGLRRSLRLTQVPTTRRTTCWSWCEVWSAVLHGFLERGVDLGDDLVEDRIVLGHAAGVDLRPGDHLAGGAVDDRDDRDEALVAEGLAVLEVGFGDFADAGAVHVDEADLDLAHDVGLVVAEVDDGAVVRQQDALLGNARFEGDLAVGDEVAGLAVHRHGVERLEDVVAVEELAGGGVAGDVDLGVALVDDVGAELEQAVDDAEDGVLVARDQAGGEDDGVALADDDAVVAVGHAGQGRHRLALGAGGHQHHAVVRQVVDVLDVDEDARRHFEVAELRGDGHVADHRAADEGHLAVVVRGGVEDLLDAVHVRGEARPR